MVTPAYTTQQYQVLCEMLARGVTSLEQNGEKVTFRSLDEMMRLKRDMERVLGLTFRPRTTYPAFRRG